jgi:hypothetical protein
VILTVVIRRPTIWRGLELEPGGVVTAPMHMIDFIAGLVERGDARAADDETRRILRAHAVGLLA